ncbi:MAG: cytidylate kinase-like family protein [Ruminococcaceae bacterium]|nr:cytidylate kinase-like family protein [Oscillospiraceae bacterium]
MNKIITIGRELGSGGRTIGKEVARRLGIEYYDRQIIDDAAKISGLSAEYIQKSEDNITGSLLYSLVMNMPYGSGCFEKSRETLPLDTQIFLAQQEAIVSLAAKGSCVIVGRCADYILKDKEKLLRCFIYAPIENRVRRAVNEYGAAENGAEKMIRQMDKKRGSRYNAFTDQIWGARANYDLMINSASFGLMGACDLIIESFDRINSR